MTELATGQNRVGDPPQPVLTGIVDADVHLPAAPTDWLRPYLSAHWSEYTRRNGFTGMADVVRNPYPPKAPTTSLPEIAAAGSAAEHLELLRHHVLDRPGVTAAIAVCYQGVEALKHPDFALEIARATNDWIASEFLDPEPRLHGTIVVPPQHPDLAADEIRRVGADSRFVQVLLPVRSERPYGNRSYYPLYEAAAELDLALCLHFGGLVGVPPTSSGYPTYYIEEYVGMAQVMQTQIMSIVAGGTFSRFPTLRVVLAECGFAWLPPVMWALDKRWKGLRREIPWVQHLPSEYIQTHFKATLQPIDAPEDPAWLLETLEEIGAPDFLMYSSDFPHRHALSPEPFLDVMPDGLRSNVLGGTAHSFYRLEPGGASSPGYGR